MNTPTCPVSPETNRKVPEGEMAMLLSVVPKANGDPESGVSAAPVDTAYPEIVPSPEFAVYTNDPVGSIATPAGAAPAAAD